MICIGLHHCQHFLAGTERRSRSTRWQWGPWGGASGRLAATARYLGLPTGPTCRVVGVRGPVGMAGLYGLAGAQRPWPSARPRTDASTPSHSASLSSKVATSAGDAPSVRARAESARRSRSTLHSAMDVARNNFPLFAPADLGAQRRCKTLGALLAWQTRPGLGSHCPVVLRQTRPRHRPLQFALAALEPTLPKPWPPSQP